MMKVTTLCVMTLPLLAVTASLAQVDNVPAAADANEWRTEFNSWFWLIGMEGDVGARGHKTDVSADCSDILEASDSVLAFSGRLEVGKGRYGFFVDGLYANLGADDQTGPLGIAEVDLTFGRPRRPKSLWKTLMSPPVSEAAACTLEHLTRSHRAPVRL